MNIPTGAVVLASGGLGHLYAVTTNPNEARGHGLAIGARAGAVIADPEFVQFHPTAIDIGRDPTPLDHYGLLAGIESAFGLPRLQNAAGATPLPLFTGKP